MENGEVENRGGICSSETVNGGEDVFRCEKSDASSADHLVIMVHGILGRSLQIGSLVLSSLFGVFLTKFLFIVSAYIWSGISNFTCLFLHTTLHPSCTYHFDALSINIRYLFYDSLPSKFIYLISGCTLVLNCISSVPSPSKMHINENKV